MVQIANNLAKSGLLLSGLLLAGCNLVRTIAPCSDGSCRPPTEFMSEIQALGVTLSTSLRPLEEAIDVRRVVQAQDGEEFLYSNSLNLYFSATDEFKEVENPDPIYNSYSDHPYVYSFSMENAGNFDSIKPFNPFSPHSFLPLEGTAFGPLHVTDRPEELVHSGNYMLQGEEMIPVRATHIELWFRTDREEDYSLISRTPLSSLLAWRNYLKPEL